MSSQLSIQGHIIELDEEISYNFQVADIADFSRLKSNYTSAFQVPKTSDVVALFEGLGVPADTSTIPYSINNVQCLDNYNIVYTGTLVVMKTEELYYQVSVISGIKDVASVLGDATLYDVLQNEILLKTPDVVKDHLLKQGSIPPDILFLFLDYGGVRQIDNQNIYDVDIMAESVYVKSLLDKIIQYTGYTYSLPSSVDTTDEMLILPIPPILEYTADGYGAALFTVNSTQSLSPGQNPSAPVAWTVSSIDNVYFTTSNGNTRIVCNKTGLYRFNFIEFYAKFNAFFPIVEYKGLVEIFLVGNPLILIGSFSGGMPANPLHYTTVLSLNSGDEISIIFRDNTSNINADNRTSFINGSFSINEVVPDDDKLSAALNMKAIDFLKELTYRYMLTPIQSGNHIDFISLYDILTEWDAVDWSDRYIRRTSETYTLNYAQNNWLRHSYVDEGDSRYDLNLQSNNQNIAASKDIVKSKIFASDGLIYPIYEQEENNGSLPKPKTINRMFWVKRVDMSITDPLILKSRTIPIDQATVLASSTINTGEYTAAFNQSERWQALSSILEDTRVHSIDLNLSMVDITQLDFNKLYYFEQEAAYYFLNRLKYTKGEIAKAEFLKVKRFYPLSKMVHWDNQSSRNVYMWTDIDDTVHMVPGQDGDYKITRNVGYNYFVTIQVNTLSSGVKIVITDEADYYLEMIKGNSTTSFNIPLTVQGDLSLIITNV